MKRAILNLSGSVADLATLFEGGGIDEAAFASFVAWQIDEGTEGLIVCGTTGEGPTLTAGERTRLIRIAAAEARARVPVIAATGSNCTDKTIELTRAAWDAGADAAVVVTPYYNKPSQAGLYHHFKAIADSVDCRIILHNAPSRTNVDLLPGTVAKLAEHPNVIGIVEASTDPARPLALACATGQGFLKFSGDDATALSFFVAGGHGCISSMANVAPRLCAHLHGLPWHSGMKGAGGIDQQLAPLIQMCRQDAGLAPIKHILALLRGWRDEVRLPLVEVTPDVAARLEGALKDLLATA